MPATYDERARERKRRYYQANRERIREVQRQYRAAQTPATPARECRCGSQLGPGMRACEECKRQSNQARWARRDKARTAARQEERRQRLLPVLAERRAIAITHVRGRERPQPRTFYAGYCSWCGESFVTTNPRVRYCSSRHGHYAHKNGVPADLAQEIYERDNYICQICHEPTDPTLHYNHDDAPTVDHMLPKSVERIDEPWNLRCAHRRCNTARRAPDVTQLALAA